MIEKVPDEIWGLTVKEHPEIFGIMVGGAILGGIVGLFLPVVGIAIGVLLAVVAFMYVNRMTYKILAMSMGVIMIVTSLISTILTPAMMTLKGGRTFADALKNTPASILAGGFQFSEDLITKLGMKEFLGKGFNETVFVPGQGLVQATYPSEGLVVESEQVSQGI
ncbi:hypothetical protein [Caldisericum sp.]|uniref:hypothetical protein n=1 Tax=Caldisericum sp. TaxID=2499687 RepID=UPI003D0A9046